MALASAVAGAVLLIPWRERRALRGWASSAQGKLRRNLRWKAALYATGAIEVDTQSNQLIQNRLLAEPQYQAVLNLVEKYLHKFDVANMSTALSMCAAAAKESGLLQRQIVGNPSFVSLFHATKEAVLKDVAAVPPRTASGILSSSAHLKIVDKELFDQVVADATTRLDTFSAKDISFLVSALGKTVHLPRANFFQALVRELRSRIDTEFTARDVTSIIKGLAHLEIKDDRLLKIIGRWVVDQAEEGKEGMLKGFDPVNLAGILSGYSTLEFWDESLFTLLGKCVLAQLEDMEGREVTVCALSLAHSSESLIESGYVMENLIRSFLPRLSELDNQQFSNYCFAVGKYKNIEAERKREGPRSKIFNTDDQYAIRFQDEALSRGLHNLSIHQVLLVTYAIMRLNYRNDEKCLFNVASEFVRRCAEMTAADIVQSMYAFGRLDYLHTEYMLAMVNEIKRRKLWDEMEPLEVATCAYSLAVLQVLDVEIMEKFAYTFCEKTRDFSPQAVAMIVWAFAVLNSRTHGEAIVSAAVEDMCYRMYQYEGLSRACVMWGGAILAGTSCGLIMLKAFFSPGFWSVNFEPIAYSMLYLPFVAFSVLEGIDMDDVEGYYTCRQLFEQLTGERMGFQNERLSQRLRALRINHRANEILPQIDGLRPAGIRGDIAIPKLRLIVEVEGPQRLVLPLQEFAETWGDSTLHGSTAEVLEQVQDVIECQLGGSAEFKRQLLRKAGWRAVTVTFGENEDYIADALRRMDPEETGTTESANEGDEAVSETGEMLTPEERGMKVMEDPLSSSDAPIADPADPAVAPQAETMLIDTAAETILTEYEKKLRDKHQAAWREYKRRLAEQRGNAVGGGQFKSRLEFLQWQVTLEKELVREMASQM